MRSTLGGSQGLGHLLQITCLASSTYKALLETATSSGLHMDLAVGELVTLTASANYEVDRTADNAIPHGVVTAAERDNDGNYYLTVAVLRVYPSGTSAVPFCPKAVLRLPYNTNSTVTLGKPVIQDATASGAADSKYFQVDNSGSNADGLGMVISIDTSAKTIDLLV